MPERESPKRRFSQKTADFRRFTPSPENSSIEPKIFAENRRKPQIGLHHLSSVTFSSALKVIFGDRPKEKTR